MPPSMRAQTVAHKERLAASEAQGERRKNALRLLQDGSSISKVTHETGLSASTAYRLKNSHDSGNEEKLKKLLDAKNNHRGRKPVLSPYEERMIVDKAVFASRHGFAVDNNVMMTLQAQIASDGRKTYTKKLPSPDAIRRFRARNRDLKFRVAENVSAARLDAENEAHVDCLRTTLIQVAKKHPGIFEDPRRIWNWDETAVSGELGKKRDATYRPVRAMGDLERR